MLLYRVIVELSVDAGPAPSQSEEEKPRRPVARYRIRRRGVASAPGRSLRHSNAPDAKANGESAETSALRPMEQSVVGSDSRNDIAIVFASLRRRARDCRGHDRFLATLQFQQEMAGTLQTSAGNLSRDHETHPRRNEPIAVGGDLGARRPLTRVEKGQQSAKSRRRQRDYASEYVGVRVSQDDRSRDTGQHGCRCPEYEMES